MQPQGQAGRGRGQWRPQVGLVGAMSPPPTGPGPTRGEGKGWAGLARHKRGPLL